MKNYSISNEVNFIIYNKENMTCYDEEKNQQIETNAERN